MADGTGDDLDLLSGWITAEVAAQRLGVKTATLYAYVSRGLVSRQRSVDGRTSLFAVEDLEALAQKGRRRPAPPAPSVDVQIATAVTEIGEGHLNYRGMSVPELAESVSFEDVAELLWTATLPSEPPSCITSGTPASLTSCSSLQGSGLGD